jgi:hypothetical protein
LIAPKAALALQVTATIPRKFFVFFFLYTHQAKHGPLSLSAGDIVGIVLGSVAVVVAGAIVALYIVARRKSNAKQETLATFQPIGGVGSSPMQQSTFSQGQSSMVDPRYQDYPVQSLLNVCFSVNCLG